jgi:hypothetical protein
MVSEEGLIIEEVDLVFIIAFDLGAKVVNVHELVEAFTNSKSLVEAYWHPPMEPYPTSVAIYIAAKKLGLIDGKTTLKDFVEMGLVDKHAENERVWEEINRLHKLFKRMITHDIQTLDLDYLELGRYARLKLVTFEAEVVEPDKVEADIRETQRRIREMVQCFRIEPYLLIHNARIGVVTAWIKLRGNFTTDEIITLGKHLDQVKLYVYVKNSIRDRNDTPSITLREFIDNEITIPLQIAVLGKERYGEYKKVFEALGSEIGEDEVKEMLNRLRVKSRTQYVIVGVKEVKCGHNCFTAGDIVKRHVKEIAGILKKAEEWREFRIDAAEESLGKNLSSFEPFAVYLTTGTSLFLGSPQLSKEIKEEASGLELDNDTDFRMIMLHLVTPMEFLALSRKIFEAYNFFYHTKVKEFQQRKIRGEVVNPGEYMELRNELTDALEEYRNVAFLKMDPSWSILEYGKEVYRLTEWENVLRSALDELAELARTHYGERLAKSQLVLTVVFGIFGIFAEIEFLEKLVGLTGAVAVAALTASALRFFYRWYMGNPSFRQFLLAVVIGANVFFGLIMIFEKLIGLEREQAVVVVALIMIALTLFLTWRMDRPYVRLRIIEFEIGNLGRRSRRSRRAKKTS